MAKMMAQQAGGIDNGYFGGVAWRQYRAACLASYLPLNRASLSSVAGCGGVAANQSASVSGVARGEISARVWASARRAAAHIGEI